MKLRLGTAAVAAILVVCGSLHVIAQDEEKNAGGFKRLAALNLSQPIVDINGPFPTLVRPAKVGELVQVQIRYPISPPFPESAQIALKSRAFSAVGVYRTDGQIVALTQQPQQGVIGVGFLSAFVKAESKAESAQFTVRIKLSDGKVKEVPFAFQIKDADDEK